LFSWLDRFQPFGALMMRLALGAILLAYGYQKVIPHGALYNFTHEVTHLGLPAALGYLAAFTEFFGGMLLIIGLFTRVVGLLIVVEMAVAIDKVTLHAGITGKGGSALPMACGALALMLVFTGAGWLGLDSLLGGGGGRGASRRPSSSR
jgi:putative oxidoreductase